MGGLIVVETELTTGMWVCSYLDKRQVLTIYVKVGNPIRRKRP
jgi:hypothetical protein